MKRIFLFKMIQNKLKLIELGGGGGMSFRSSCWKTLGVYFDY